MKKKLERRRFARGTVAALIGGALLTGVSVIPVHAVEYMKMTGAIHCNAILAGVRTTSTSKGTTTHQVFHPNYQNVSWYQDPGYSANYANWDFPWYGVYADDKSFAYGNAGITRGGQYCG